MRLVLHVDINKTIIIEDKASNVHSVDAMLNSIIAECAWGRRNEEGEFELVSKEPTSAPPQVEGVEASSILSYGDYLEETQERGPARRQAKVAFTTTPLGRCFQEHLEKLRECMRIKDNGPGGRHTSTSINTGSSGEEMHFIVPAFYKLMITLVERGVDFSVCFRSFGHDIQDVVDEFNSFCSGTHPLYPLKGSTGSGPGTLLSVLRSKCIAQRARLERRGEGAESVVLILKEVEVEKEEKEGEENDGEGERIEGAMAVKACIDRWLCSGSVAIQDDFMYWHAHDESDDAGKLLLLSYTDEEETNKTVTLFFDDNIERGHAHIVDARYVDTEGRFSPVPYATSKGRYLIRATPYDVILDDNTFVQQVDDALTLRQMGTGAHIKRKRERT